jgi:hypothetical protein
MYKRKRERERERERERVRGRGERRMTESNEFSGNFLSITTSRPAKLALGRDRRGADRRLGALSSLHEEREGGAEKADNSRQK